MMLVKLAAGLALAYGGAVAALFLAQTWMIFPASLAIGGPPLPPGAERLEVTAPDGTRLIGHHVPAPPGTPPAPMILGFGGNAWNADTMVATLHDLYPDHPVAGFHYRGYGPSGGRPGAAAVLDDALTLHDALVERLAPAGVVPVGFSLGGGPAARLAAERPVGGAILVTAFGSLTDLAADKVRWAPVRLLLRHAMPVAEDVARADVPIATVTAAADTLVTARHSRPIAESAGGRLVYDRAIPGAGHETIFAHPDFAPAMREALAAVEAAG